jgi:hypothetical protein
MASIQAPFYAHFSVAELSCFTNRRRSVNDFPKRVLEPANGMRISAAHGELKLNMVKAL